MEQIIRNYGRFLVCGMAFAAAFWLFFGREGQADAQWSVRRAAAAEFMPAVNEAGDEDLLTLNTEGARPAPRIIWKYAGALDTGSYAVGELTEASDYAGAPVAVQVRGIEGEEAGSGVLIEDEGRVLRFLRKGIYLLRLSAADAQGRRSICEVQVAVNGR